MSLDTVLYIIFLIPLLFMLFKQEHLLKRKNIITYLLVSIIVVIAGVIYEKTTDSETKSLAYFGSQIPLLFIISHVIFGSLFFKIFNRYPEIDQYADKFIDAVYSIFLIVSIVVLPVLIEEYIVKQL